MKPIRLSFLLFIICLKSSFCQTKQPIVDPFSTASFHVEMMNKSKIIGSATGFFLDIKSKCYFITNNHVVGGAFYNSEFKNGVVPDSMRINNLRLRLYENKINSTFYIDLPLIKKSDTLYVKFWEDNNKTKLMDVVAIPISDAVKTQLQTPILGIENIQQDLHLAPATDLFIVGFPFDYWRISNYPIWKRGSIASEPNLDRIGEYSFLIDATTRQGMSGSPVFYRGGLYSTETATQLSAPNTTFLVGIYSAQSLPMEIGVVWKINKIVQDLLKQN